MNTTLNQLNALDITTVLLHAYQIGELINRSYELDNYLNLKSISDQNPEIKALYKQFQQKKQLFEECERYGHYHPDYHKALSEVNQIQETLNNNETFAQLQLAEYRLNELFFTISQTIASSISESIKVPDFRETVKASGCSSGGGCSGKCS